MSNLTLDEQAEQLAYTLTDWNYIPTIGVLEVDGAETLDDVKRAIKKEFPDTEPFEEKFYSFTKEKMFKMLRQYMEHDQTPTRDMTVHDIPKETVKRELAAFLDRLETHVAEGSAIYWSGMEKGLPMSYIFWEFAFVVVNKDGKSLFLYGAASD
jgi:hypothetical protein